VLQLLKKIIIGTRDWEKIIIGTRQDFYLFASRLFAGAPRKLARMLAIPTPSRIFVPSTLPIATQSICSMCGARLLRSHTDNKRVSNCVQARITGSLLSFDCKHWLMRQTVRPHLRELAKR